MSWANLVATAYGRAAEIGVTAATWTEAQSELGRTWAAILVLLADADSVERGGTVRWTRAMAAPAETESLHLRRTSSASCIAGRTQAAPDGEEAEATAPVEASLTKSRLQRWLGPSGSAIGARVPVARLRPRRRRTASPSSE